MSRLPRRALLQAGALPLLMFVPWRAQALTPACDDGEPTPPQTAGPFFLPNSPQRASLIEPGIRGRRLVVAGQVWSQDCQPLAGALIDVWHADAAGEYDNRGFRLRGHQFSNRAGRYTLETILPGLYPGRTRHIHVRVQAPGRPILTTQLYFPGEPLNGRDGLFRPELLIAMPDSPQRGSFDFVLG